MRSMIAPQQDVIRCRTSATRADATSSADVYAGPRGGDARSGRRPERAKDLAGA